VGCSGHGAAVIRISALTFQIDAPSVDATFLAPALTVGLARCRLRRDLDVEGSKGSRRVSYGRTNRPIVPPIL
jgi:hypothetical protein